MSFGTALAFVIAVLGLCLALFYGVRASVHLARVKKLRPLAADRGVAVQTDVAHEVPSMRFHGEAFEARWQGSRGYAGEDYGQGAATPDGLRVGENWTDRLVIPLVKPLRPSRFSDPKYWTRYLPGVFLTWVVLFVGIPLVSSAIAQTSTGAVGSFVPSAQQRAVPDHSTDYVTNAPVCSHPASSAATSSPPVWVSDTGDGTVFAVPHDRTVGIRYLYGRPVFSPGVPLCALALDDRSGVVEYRSTASGAGFIYLAQPNGTVVAKIEIAPDYSSVVFLVLALSAIVICFDVAVTLRLRRATTARYSDR